MSFLQWLENSLLGYSVGSVSWVYPWVNAFHSVGMGFLVGVVFMICLRVLGFGGFPIAPLEKYLLVVRSAFVLSLATGFALFAADAERFFFSPTFRIKALLIVLGGVTAWRLSKMVFSDGAAWSNAGDAPLTAKVIAGVSLIFWVGAIFAGRLTAYLP